MNKYGHILTKLDLSKNESSIYETLLEHGELGVSTISLRAGIHRRNVYDSINRLKEKGFVFEILKKEENAYHAVDPRKLMEHVKEKEIMLSNIMPELERMYVSSPASEAVYIYKGVEGWKNYLRDILDVSEDVYTIGGKGAWGDKRLDATLSEFMKKAKKKNIQFHALYDGDANIPKNILDNSKNRHKFLPKKFPSTSTVDMFGDRIVLTSNVIGGRIDSESTLTVIINRSAAESFRTWFKMIWSLV